MGQRLWRPLVAVVLALAALVHGLDLFAAQSEQTFILARLVDGVSRKPIAAASASLRGPGADLPTQISDANGRVLFRPVLPGSYVLTATANGYIDGGSGQTAPGEIPRQFEVQRNRPAEVELRLWRYARLGGRVTDQFGEPVVGAPVRAVLVGVSGSANAGRPSTAQTDDRGQYLISNLIPGAYIVVAPTAWIVPSMASRSAQLRATPGGLVLQTTYFRNVTTSSLAERVVFRAGEERRDIDLIVRIDKSFTITGAVVDMLPGTPPLRVRLMAAQEPPVEVAAVEASGQGEFSFPSVAPGEYMIVATQTLPRPAQGVDGATGPRDIRWARMPLTVLDTDITRIVVPLHPGLMVKGVLRIEGSGSASLTRFAGLSVSAQPGTFTRAGPDQLAGFTASAKIEADGRFQLGPLVPGSYSFQMPAGRSWRLRGVRIAGRVGPPLTTLDVRDHKDVELVVSDRFGTLVGRVSRDSSGDSGVSVFVFPLDGASSHLEGKDDIAFRRVEVPASGEFIVEALPAGSYYAAAVPAGRFPSEWRETNILSELTAVAARFAVVDRERRDLVLRLGR
jgi:hypothetical protein